MVALQRFFIKGKDVGANKAVEGLAEIWEYSYDTWSERQADKYHEMQTSRFQEIHKCTD